MNFLESLKNKGMTDDQIQQFVTQQNASKSSSSSDDFQDDGSGYPRWVQEVHSKGNPSRSPASDAFLTDDEMAEMARPAKYVEPESDEVNRVKELIDSYRSQGVNDGTQLVPLYNKLAELRKADKDRKTKVPQVAEPVSQGTPTNEYKTFSNQRGLLSDDQIAEMSKVSRPKKSEPMEAEAKALQDQIDSLKQRGINESDQLVPLYNKLGTIKNIQKAVREAEQTKLDQANREKFPEFYGIKKPDVDQEPKNKFDFDKPYITPQGGQGYEFTPEYKAYLAKRQERVQSDKLPEVLDEAIPEKSKTESTAEIEQQPAEMPVTTEVTKKAVKAQPVAGQPKEVATSAKVVSDSNAPNPTSKIGAGQSVKTSTSVKVKGSSMQDDLKSFVDMQKGFTENTVENLRKVQEEANELRKQNVHRQAMNKLSAGIIGAVSGYHVTPTETDMYDKQADQLEKDFKARVEKEQDDPNSQYSVGFRNFAKPMVERLGMDAKILEGLNGKQIGEVNKYLKDMYDTKLRSEELALRREEQRMNRLDKEDQRKELKLLGLYTTWKNKLPSLGGQAANANRTRINQAGAIFGTFGLDRDTTADDVAKLADEDLRQYGRMVVTESAIELNKLLSGSGAPARKTLEDIVPHNILMDYTKLKDYFTNDMNPAKQANFIRQVLKVAARVRDNAQSQLVDVYKADAAGRGMFWDHPVIGPQFEATLKVNGLNDQQIDQIKNLQTPSAQPKIGAQVAPSVSEIKRIDRKSGKTAIFDANTKKFIRWE